MSSYQVDPWGQIDWLMPRLGNKSWSVLLCAGSEERSVALTRWALANRLDTRQVSIARIDDQASSYSEEVTRLTDLHEEEIRRSFRIDHYNRDYILGDMSRWNEFRRNSAPGGSVILDISAMPKRVFAFLLKGLVSDPQVKDVVITYCRPESYPEGPLSEGASAPVSLPGFAREVESHDEVTVIVGVGFISFDLDELLEQRYGKTISFLMPFPPASPSVRRNWKLLKKLHPPVGLEAQVKRINGMDIFEACRWLTSASNASNGAFDMIPLGPKPHVIAMALAHMKIGERSQITYAQPTIYRPDYSLGIASTTNGKMDMLAYCLRKDGINLF